VDNPVFGQWSPFSSFDATISFDGRIWAIPRTTTELKPMKLTSKLKYIILDHLIKKYKLLKKRDRGFQRHRLMKYSPNCRRDVRV